MDQDKNSLSKLDDLPDLSGNNLLNPGRAGGLNQNKQHKFDDFNFDDIEGSQNSNNSSSLGKKSNSKKDAEQAQFKVNVSGVASKNKKQYGGAQLHEFNQDDDIEEEIETERDQNQ